ncbi:MAG: hypothetical protein KAX78_11745, partial [Phycisphaerae bacterium]|nr:hypothetical protein [Phycisphaerae bacterium]
ATDNAAELSIHVRAYARIAMVDIFRDQQIVRTWGDTKHAAVSQRINPAAEQVWVKLDGKAGEDGKETDLKWREDRPEKGTHNYYVRVILEGGEMAWSSPIWATYP